MPDPTGNVTTPLHPVVLLTDFGDSDPFVGQMKGVIAEIAPGATVIDLCHKVPPQRIDIAALFLEGSQEYFPAGSVIVAVVDPGVGTSRRAIVVSVYRRFFVGPDNGIFFPLIRGATWSAVQIENPRFQLSEVSSTFHGRDIFAPTAAHLAKGVTMDSIGRKISALTPLVVPKARRDGDVIHGEIVHIDTFGNGWSNISKRVLQESGAWPHRRELAIRVGNTMIGGVSDAYQQGSKDKPVAVINSFNLLEIAWPSGSADRKLGLRQGLPIEVRISD